jgi:protein TonB
MDTHAILTADLLDVIFEHRNKDYGAYELRRTYTKRVIKSLGITTVITCAVFTLVAFGKKSNGKTTYTPPDKIVTVESLPTDPVPKKPAPEPIRQNPPAKPTRAEDYTTNIQIVADNVVTESAPEQTDFINADIGTKSIEGDNPGDIITSVAPTGSGVEPTEQVKKEPDAIEETVDISASFDGNWQKFLLRNLNGNIPLNNDAPPGVYKVMIQFVVDLDGSLSDLRPLTNHGYGLEEEAMRVIKKSKNWEPAVKRGVKVKSYRRQPITFEVNAEE